jgi:ADP-ribosyl-[dinitrogen reductase] hydrolase
VRRRRCSPSRRCGAPSDPGAAARQLGSSGFVVHSVGLCTWAFARGAGVHDSLRLAIRAGGDTDTHAAIVGGWTGALHGDGAVPPALLRRLAPGPFGARHLGGLAATLVQGGPPPGWSALGALVRNLGLYPVVLAHGLRRLVPFG